MDELLTDKEHEIVWRLGSIYRDLKHVISDGAQQEYDLNEATLHIHALQHMVMAQAAGRAYPDKYRLLGDSAEQ
jgi:hypothetical protein